MFGSYLQGFIGIAVAIAGAITMLAGVFDAAYFFVGLLMVFGGGYMKYLSSQTIRVGDDLTDAGLGQLNTRPINEGNDVFEGSKDVLNDDYRFFLVEKYKIKKNENLNKFLFYRNYFETVNGASFDTLDEGINAANEREKSDGQSHAFDKKYQHIDTITFL